jgi:transcriptional regulator with XRE-family HTH domain
MKNTTSKYQLIGKKIKEVREIKGWSQKKLANAIGFESSTAISLIESGDRRVAIEDLEKIASVLSRNIGYFLGQENKIDMQSALRADSELTPEDQDQIFDFYQFVKNKKNANKNK